MIAALSVEEAGSKDNEDCVALVQKGSFDGVRFVATNRSLTLVFVGTVNGCSQLVIARKSKPSLVLIRIRESKGSEVLSRVVVVLPLCQCRDEFACAKKSSSGKRNAFAAFPVTRPALIKVVHKRRLVLRASAVSFIRPIVHRGGSTLTATCE